MTVDTSAQVISDEFPVEMPRIGVEISPQGVMFMVDMTIEEAVRLQAQIGEAVAVAINMQFEEAQRARKETDQNGG